MHDAIINSLKNKTLTYLSVSSSLVKAILIASAILSHVSGQDNQETLILAKGEQLELTFETIKQYSIGNKDILSSKTTSNGKSLFIKGKSIGYTDLLVWSKNRKKQYQVYVISKKNHLEHAKILEVFKPPHWVVGFEGTSIALKGELKTTNQWLVLQELQHKKITMTLQDVSIDKYLKRELIGSTYKKISSLGIRNFRCEIQELPLMDCIGQNHLSSLEQKILKNKYPYIRWSKFNQLAAPRNIRAKIKLLSFDFEQGEDWQKGFGYLQGQLHQIFDGAFWSMIKFNSVNFKKYWNKVQVLAEPEFTLLPDTKANFSVGSEIPYWSRNNGQEQQQIAWKFAGLKVEITLQTAQDLEKIKVIYHTSLTSPLGEQIQGHDQQAELLVRKNENSILFDINYQSLTNNEQGIPFWKKIPILYHLFADERGHQNQKKITAIINLSEIDS